MRAMKEMKGVPKTKERLTTPGKRGMMLRRAANHNVHVMTPHGRIFAGRKGRRG